jgi:hypothetical protein
MNIEELANKAGINVSNNKSSEVWVSDLKEFANFVREATLEEAAYTCERLISGDGLCAADGVWIYDCAAAIRGLK